MAGVTRQMDRWLQEHYQLGSQTRALEHSFDKLRQWFNADLSTVELTQRASPAQSQIWTRSYSQGDLDFYFQHMQDDVLLNTYLARDLVGEAVIADRLLPFERIDNPVFRDCLVPYFKTRYALCVLAPVSQGQDLAITLHRHYGHAPFSEHERLLLQRVTDRLQGWVLFYQQLARQAQQQAQLTALLDHETGPRGLVDGGGRLLFANAALRQRLPLAEVRLYGERLILPGALHGQWLTSLARGEGGELVLRRGQLEPCLFVWQPLSGPPCGFVVRLLEPHWEQTRQTDHVALLYGLSPMEQEVLMLLSCGLTGPEVARLRGVSKETLRSQLKSLLHKTRCGNQNELLNLLFNLSV